MGEEQQQMTEHSFVESARMSLGSLWPRMPWTAMAWAWSAFIVLICLAPHNPGSPSTLPWDKLAHFLLFAGFGLFWLGACPRQMVRIAIAGTLLGLGIEILQSTLGWGRMGDGADFAADCIGLFSGLLVSARFSSALLGKQ